MKIVINKCYGGFGLSNEAIKRLAELNGKKCYFFTTVLEKGENYGKYKSIDITDNCIFSSAFSVSNPDQILDVIKREDYNDSKEYNKAHNKLHESISLSAYDEDRTNPLLIQVVEELGNKASSKYAQLSIIEIPDGIEYEIDEYDGIESIHEKHRSW